MPEILLTIIAFLLVILITVLYQVKKELANLPKTVIQAVLEPIQAKVNALAKEIKHLKNEMANTYDKEK